MMNYFGEEIRSGREEKRWSPQELINELEIYHATNITLDYLRRIEACTEIPNTFIIRALASVLDINVSALMSQAKKEELIDLQRKINEKYRRFVK